MPCARHLVASCVSDFDSSQTCGVHTPGPGTCQVRCSHAWWHGNTESTCQELELQNVLIRVCVESGCNEHGGSGCIASRACVTRICQDSRTRGSHRFQSALTGRSQLGQRRQSFHFSKLNLRAASAFATLLFPSAGPSTSIGTSPTLQRKWFNRLSWSRPSKSKRNCCRAAAQARQST